MANLFRLTMTLADRLMQMAARRSTETQFGWAHPDCEDLGKYALDIGRKQSDLVGDRPAKGVSHG